MFNKYSLYVSNIIKKLFLFDKHTNFGIKSLPRKLIKKHIDTALTETNQISSELSAEIKKIESTAKIDPDLL